MRGALVLFVIALAAAFAWGFLTIAQRVAGDVEQRVPACVVPTSSGCPDGPTP